MPTRVTTALFVVGGAVVSSARSESCPPDVRASLIATREYQQCQAATGFTLSGPTHSASSLSSFCASCLPLFTTATQSNGRGCFEGTIASPVVSVDGAVECFGEDAPQPFGALANGTTSLSPPTPTPTPTLTPQPSFTTTPAVPGSTPLSPSTPPTAKPTRRPRPRPTNNATHMASPPVDEEEASEEAEVLPSTSSVKDIIPQSKAASSSWLSDTVAHDGSLHQGEAPTRKTQQSGSWVGAGNTPQRLQPRHSNASTPPTGSALGVGAYLGIAGIALSIVVMIIAFLVWRRHRTRSGKCHHGAESPLDDGAMTRRRTDRFRADYVAFGGRHDSDTEPPILFVGPGDDSVDASSESMAVPEPSKCNDIPDLIIKLNYREASPNAAPFWVDPTVSALRIPFASVVVGEVLRRDDFAVVHAGTYYGTPVAVKMLPQDDAPSIVQLNRLVHEATILATIEHERIARFIGLAWDSLSELRLVSARPTRGHLRELLNSFAEEQHPCGLGDPVKVKIAMHVAHGLAYLHAMKTPVLHRDLKSRHVGLDDDLNAKLTDFAIAREYSEQTMTAGVGSRLWMAPEVLRGSRYDEKSDIFSFGIVLSELDHHTLPYAHTVESGRGHILSDSLIAQQVARGELAVTFTAPGPTAEALERGIMLAIAELGRSCITLDPMLRPTAGDIHYRLRKLLQQMSTTDASIVVPDQESTI